MKALDATTDDPDMTRRRLTRLAGVLRWAVLVAAAALPVAFGSDDAAAILVGLVFLAVAWILREGRRIADENALMI